MGQIYHFNQANLYINITYITKLLMQFHRLNEANRLLLFEIEMTALLELTLHILTHALVD